MWSKFSHGTVDISTERNPRTPPCGWRDQINPQGPDGSNLASWEESRHLTPPTGFESFQPPERVDGKHRGLNMFCADDQHLSQGEKQLSPGAASQRNVDDVKVSKIST